MSSPLAGGPPALATRYPDSDGKPMADNTYQAEWIMLIYENLEALFADDANVFVAADNLIYPVKAESDEDPPRAAPDVCVVFGRPKGHRGSYKYWIENDVPVTVAFEILSPGNTHDEMEEKFDFYEEHGIEEYYVYYPQKNRLRIYVRKQMALARVRPVEGFVSPRMGIRFDMSGPELVVRYPDGRPFVRLKDERKRADQAEQRLRRALELAGKVRQGQATPAELEELEQMS